MTETRWTNPKTTKRLRRHRFAYAGLGTLVSLCLILYLMVFLPLSRHITDLAGELEDTHARLTASGFGDPRELGSHSEQAAAKLERMQELLERVEAQARFYSDQEGVVEADYGGVLEFEQRRFELFRTLSRLAEEKNSQLPDHFATNFPVYSTEIEHPQRIWFRLDFLYHCLSKLLESGPALQIEKVEVLPETLHPRPGDERDLLELRLRIRVTGEPRFLAPFLNGALPDDTERQNRAYSIERIDLSSAAAAEGTPDGHVTLDLSLSGFVLTRRTI